MLPDRLNIRASDVQWSDVEGAAAGGERKLRRFAMVAYTGSAMSVREWPHPVVIDLAGLTVSDKPRPIFKDHSSAQIVGHTDSIRVDGGALKVTGVISGAGPAAREVILSSENGFPWQASVGAAVEEAEFVPERQVARVNGKEYPGPIHVARRAVLGEISFVALGADDETSAQLAAKAPGTKASQANPNKEKENMDFEAWLKAQGFELERLSETQKASLKAHFDRETATAVAELPEDEGEDSDEQEAVPAPAPASPASASPASASPAAPAATPAPSSAQISAAAPAVPNPQGTIEDLRARYSAEQLRIAAVERICGTEHRALVPKAVAEGWNQERTELEVLRAARPKPSAPSAHVASSGVNTRTLEAACAATARLQGIEQVYDEQTLDAAAKRFRGGIGLQELLLEAAWANGYSGRNFRDARSVFRFAFTPDLVGGFSTIDIGGILSNVANKFLLEGFYSVERTWRNIAAIRNVTDFKTVTSYRLVGSDQYEPVPPGGEIKHGKLGEETYQNRADTYALMLSIDRRDMINDDLGAITTVPRKLGRGSGLKINDVFWKVFLDNGGFFKLANKNLLEGAATALGIDGLTGAEVAFLDQTDADGQPIGVMPSILLLPTALSALGTQLRNSTELRDTTANSKFPVSNPHQGKFRIEVSRYLSNARYTGNSAKAWYLLAAPEDLPTIEVAFLNGQESPTIETADADFSVLGVRMRGYHDFGVALQDPRGGVKAKGEA